MEVIHTSTLLLNKVQYILMVAPIDASEYRLDFNEILLDYLLSSNLQ
jgi:hypothetical protein